MEIYVATDKVKVGIMCFIPQWLIPDTLMSALFPREACSILLSQVNMLLIYKTHALIWAWIHICLLEDQENLQGLDYMCWYTTCPDTGSGTNPAPLFSLPEHITGSDQMICLNRYQIQNRLNPTPTISTWQDPHSNTPLPEPCNAMP